MNLMKAAHGPGTFGSVRVFVPSFPKAWHLERLHQLWPPETSRGEIREILPNQKNSHQLLVNSCQNQEQCPTQQDTCP